MLPVYKAISFQTIMQGGRTRPWLVLVNQNGTEKPYVVKMFNESDNNIRGSIVNEVIGNYLANEFDFLVPSAALIEMNSEFESTVSNAEAYRFFEFADQRIKFGCEYIPGVHQFIDGVFPELKLENMVELDRLFAFDALIQNEDRGLGRSNILLKESNAYLIDHELALEIGKIPALNERTVDNVYKQHRDHIFYKYLKLRTVEDKKHFFTSFSERLKYINFKKINEYCHQLEQFDYLTDKHRDLVRYLEDIRRNSPKFVSLLHQMIS